MIIIKIFGGLGNQMFQYAFGKALSLKYNRELVIDKSYFEKENHPFDLHPTYYPYKLGLYNMDCEFVSRNISKYTRFIKQKRMYYLANPLMSLPIIRKHIPEYFCKRNFNFNKLEKTKNAYLEGFWQKYELLDEFKAIIRNELTLPNNLIKNRKLLNQVKTSNSVAVHFRLGDYVSNPKFAAVFVQCSLNYYKKAMDYLNEKLNAPTFFIFSDTINSVKVNLKTDSDLVFIDNEDADHEHLYIMSQCKHNIIANSSFSWWGAWLNDNPEKIVIAPEKWFKDEKRLHEIYYPNEWKEMNND